MILILYFFHSIENNALSKRTTQNQLSSRSSKSDLSEQDDRTFTDYGSDDREVDFDSEIEFEGKENFYKNESVYNLVVKLMMDWEKIKTNV